MPWHTCRPITIYQIHQTYYGSLYHQQSCTVIDTSALPNIHEKLVGMFTRGDLPSYGTEEEPFTIADGVDREPGVGCVQEKLGNLPYILPLIQCDHLGTHYVPRCIQLQVQPGNNKDIGHAQGENYRLTVRFCSIIVTSYVNVNRY